MRLLTHKFFFGNLKYFLLPALVLSLNTNALSQDFLIATCNGPGGYCNPGDNVTVKYISGGNNLTGKPTWVAETGIVLVYCPTPDGHNIPSTVPCRALHTTPVKGNTEGVPWSNWIGAVTGVFHIPVDVPMTNGLRCIAAYLSDGDGKGNKWARAFGTSTPSTFNSTCSGYAPPPPPPDYCYINGGNPISVQFGNVERSDISTNPGGTGTIRKNINLSCVGNGDHTINIKLNMTPTSWSNSQIHTSNGALGVSVSENGRMLTADESFNIHINGNNSLSHELVFSLLRNPGAKVTDITTGTFNASASLIITQP
ncbi:fimbrial protein [Klebsiella aerogenes]